MKLLIRDLAAKQADYLVQNLPLFVAEQHRNAIEQALYEAFVMACGQAANAVEPFHTNASGEAHRVDGASALDTQVGGDHYNMPIQHVEFCQRNRLPWCESAAIKYLVRHKRKNGLQDVRKAIHYIELMAEMEYGVTPTELHQKPASG